MVAPKSGSVKTVVVAVALSAVVGFVLACASTAPDLGDATTASMTDVEVYSGEDGTSVTLVGLSYPVYTDVFDEDMQAVVLELASVDARDVTDRVEVYDGVIDYVTVSTYAEDGGEPITRVEVTLGTEADYAVTATDEGLRIDLFEGAWEAGDEQGEGMAEADPWADAAVDEVEVADAAVPASYEEAVSLSEPVRPPVATSLSAVEVATLSTGVLLHIEADGSIAAVESFVLDDPDRLVVDLPGLTSNAAIDTVAVDHAMIERVRVGVHADKVRIVVDGGAEAAGFAGRSIKPSADGLYVAVGAGEEVEVALADALGAAEAAWNEQAMTQIEAGEALDAAPETAWETADGSASEWEADAAYAEETTSEAEVADTDEDWQEPAADGSVEEIEPLAGVAIHGVHYSAMDNVDRVAVLSEAVVDYKVHSPDADTVVVSLFGATISPQVAGRIRGAAGGPVSLVTIFEQPDVEGSEVRVVVTRAPNQEPLISRRGPLLFIDFEHLGVAAAAPPAFPERETTGLTLAEADAGETPAADDGMTPQSEDAPVAEFDEDGTQLVAQDTSLDELPEYSETPAEMDQELTGNEMAIPVEDDEFASLSGPLEDLDGLDDFDGSEFEMGAPASLEPPAAVEVLQEGGLVDGKKYEGRRISLDFNNVPISDVLRLIAEVSDLNLIAGDEVKGGVTIRLVDVPWDQALDVVLLTKGLGFVRVGNILRVAPSDILAAEEELRLQERRNKEKLEDLMVKLLPVNYAAVKDMQKLVKRLLSSRGTVNIDERTNTLILKDIASVIDESVALVKAVDTETPQVMIEAKIVEANLNFGRELGSSWSVGAQSLVDPFSGTVARDDLGNSDFRLHGSNSVAFSNPITSTPTALMDLGAFLLNEKIDLDVSLRAAESMGEGKVISSPRIVTLDNGEATIEQGVSIPFQTFEGGDAKLEFIDAVLSLKVVPHITSDRSIIMDIEVTRNAPDESVATPTGSPAIAKAEAATETLVKDGQTLVIGGIYTIDKTERESRVPYLYRLPVIGAAFRSKELTDIRKELLIFVTPRVVKSPSLGG